MEEILFDKHKIAESWVSSCYEDRGIKDHLQEQHLILYSYPSDQHNQSSHSILVLNYTIML